MGKIGLALGGGAVLGAAHIGVLRAIEEHNLEISYISGTSIGAFVGAFYAFGMPSIEIEKVALKLKWMDISGLSFSGSGLLSNKKLGELIVDHIGECNFEECKIPLSMIATDAASGDKVVLNDGSIAEAVMASTCIPGVFCPINRNDLMLIDGGIVENVPISTAREMGAEYVIGVDLNGTRKHKKPGHILDVIVNSFHFMLRSATQYQTERADLLVSPDLSDYDMISTDHVSELIEAGYKEMSKVLEEHDRFEIEG